MKVNIVFDIDGVLACSRAEVLEEYFRRRGLVFSAIKTQYIFPGVVELMRKLFATEGVRVTFFSSGKAIRNREFVKKLLVHALGKPGWRSIRHDVQIVSREEMASELGKDLSLVLREGETFANTVLVDDQIRNRLKGQELSFLYAKEVKTDDFIKLKEKIDRYDANGSRFLPCLLLNAAEKGEWCEVFDSAVVDEEDWCVVGECDDVEVEVKKKEENAKLGNSIIIRKGRGSFEINVANIHTGEPITRSLGGTEFESQLTALYEEGRRKGAPMVVIEDPLLLQEIRTLVESIQGRTTKILRAVNRIYYVAGLLFKALEYAKEKQQPITSYLFAMQFHQSGPTTHESHYRQTLHVDAFYHYGLMKLREVNPRLQFTTPINYFS